MLLGYLFSQFMMISGIFGKYNDVGDFLKINRLLRGLFLQNPFHTYQFDEQALKSGV